jgi:hypothetical protein
MHSETNFSTKNSWENASQRHLIRDIPEKAFENILKITQIVPQSASTILKGIFNRSFAESG